ncbi:MULTISPECIES: hypothetical protein [unclassified Streptomyces]|uniref:hypothetical protein n=1 Tax=unclassified Streptomyces TaxID=2593676 RepID=UPI001BEAA5DD|nr:MULTISPECIES: hypothetical protein [unclassified Streptomyces]MBT2405030.1 hypothetical protein [Streptomyces sp. ISL-21]MBT2456998.1 hypothetical protein [Streptomyces sp. ISL-86]MBT2610756.1 hypothetical protein [Streptomyces sp. ISL-87]
MRLGWPYFTLKYNGAQLEFEWQGACLIEVHVHRCVSAGLHPPGPDGTGQLVFQFSGAESGSSDLIETHIDVPAQSLPETERFLAMLRHDHGVPGRSQGEAEDTELKRVPRGDGWLVSDAGPASEELFRDVMARAK